MSHNIVPIDLGERSYDVNIGKGLHDEIGHLIKPLLPSNRVIIITDENVDAAGYSEKLIQGFDKAALSSDVITVPAGEASKSFTQLEELLNDLLELKPDRKTTIVALGGGVVGDLAGFAASVLLRSVPFVQVPTSLLAMVDSSVGGKTGIDTNFGKNLVGSFYQPLSVIIDTDSLNTLPERQQKAGYAEVVKYGLINDAEFFGALEDVKVGYAEMIETSCKAKAAIVAEDEREAGKRALLNLGHTFGHALELEVGYDDDLLHGEAVAIGMVMAFEFSHQLGYCAGSDVNRVKEHLASAGLPINPKEIRDVWNIDRLISHMHQDKKASNGELNFVLVRGIGKAFLAGNVDIASLTSFMKECCS